MPENGVSKSIFVVGAGFHKTGTSTLGAALRILGYHVKGTSKRPLIPILKKDFSYVRKQLRNFDAVQDTPWFFIYKELDEIYPNAKFILTIRDEESWYKSVKKQIGDLRSAQDEWIYGRGKGLPKDDKQNAIDVYNRHNEEVKNYFKDRPNDLLILNFKKGDKWEKLCDFLNEDIPSEPFPHYNKSKTSKMHEKKSKTKIMRRKMKNALKIKYIDLFHGWD